VPNIVPGRLAAPSIVLVLLLTVLPATAQDWDEVEIGTEPLNGGLHMLTGAGGNLIICPGEDGVFLVDDQFAPLSDRILAAIAEISDRPVRFVINTHWHGDHTGGNENMGKAGAILVAHDNVRERMSAEQFIELWDRTVEPSPPGALPVVTFNDTVTFHLNGETIEIFHLENAHTDGDGVVHFKNANVIHAGDILFNGSYPYIDVHTGGSVNGVLAAVDAILERCDDRTQIVCGHGPLADRAALETYRDVVMRSRDAVQALIDAGKSLEEIQAAKPTATWDAEWGTGFIEPDVFVKLIYQSLTGGP
jgi:glyoxylase-like metal-dependent hydrolase (beta-lactamase superfamily II)